MANHRLKCKVCGVEWTYAGYPNLMCCPNCDADEWEHEYISHEEICPECKGTGKVMTSVVHEPLYDGCNCSLDSIRISKEILKREQSPQINKKTPIIRWL